MSHEHSEHVRRKVDEVYRSDSRQVLATLMKTLKRVFNRDNHGRVSKKHLRGDLRKQAARGRPGQRAEGAGKVSVEYQ